MATSEEIHGLVVVKVGSSTLTDETGGIDDSYIAYLCDQVATLMEMGHPVVVVTSGAAAAGRKRLGIDKRPSDIPTLQACAACGQAALTETYAERLSERGLTCAQVLLTRRDVVDRDGYLNARNTLMRLLDLGVVPVVNENDTVSVAEFAFGDNDMLGAIVSALVGAELYVILSDVEGLFTANPETDESAELIDEVNAIDRHIAEIAGGSVSSVGTGGMASKVRAARAMLAAGIPMVVAHGGRRKGRHPLRERGRAHPRDRSQTLDRLGRGAARTGHGRRGRGPCPRGGGRRATSWGREGDQGDL